MSDQDDMTARQYYETLCDALRGVSVPSYQRLMPGIVRALSERDDVEEIGALAVTSSLIDVRIRVVCRRALVALQINAAKKAYEQHPNFARF